MSIDDQPMNVYWSGKRTETSSTFKITDKGSVAEYTDLPSSGNQKGDKYEVTDDGSDYIWNGSTWSRLGAEKYAYEDIVGMPDFALDANVVHKTDAEVISGKKTFSSSPEISASNPSFAIKNTSFSKGGETAGWGGIAFTDKDAKGLGKIEAVYSSSSGDVCVKTSVFEGTPASSTSSLAIENLYNSASDMLVYRPATTQKGQLGDASHLWADIHAAASSISSSDARVKTEPEAIPDAVLDAWGEVDFVQFQMLDAVERKGVNARLHSGMIAQQIAAAFTTYGLDATRYGLFCHDAWEAQEALEDDDGNVVSAGQNSGDLYGLRYVEALCMEAAYQRRRADRLEARIKALEEKLK